MSDYLRQRQANPNLGRRHDFKVDPSRENRSVWTSVIREFSNYALSSTLALQGVYKHLDKLDEERRLNLREFFEQLKRKRCFETKKSTYVQEDLARLDQKVYEAFVADMLDPKIKNEGPFLNRNSYYFPPREDIWTFMKNIKVSSFQLDPNETLESFMDRVGKPLEKNLEEFLGEIVKVDERQGSEQPALPCSPNQQRGCQNSIAEEAKVPVPASPGLPFKRGSQEEAPNSIKKPKVPENTPHNERREGDEEHYLPNIYWNFYGNGNEAFYSLKAFGIDHGPPEDFAQEFEEALSLYSADCSLI
jgi:hypothetical protein